MVPQEHDREENKEELALFSREYFVPAFVPGYSGSVAQ